MSSDTDDPNDISDVGTMNGAHLLAVTAARSLLLLALGVAGITKLRDLPGARQAIAAFGVPDRLVAPLAVVIPVLELLCAAALVAAATVRAGAAASVALLLVFSIGIMARLVRGERPSCRCFGVLSAGPIGWSTLLRNGVLLASGGMLLLSGPHRGFVTTLSQLLADARPPSGVALALAGLTVLIGLQFLLSIQLMRQHGRLLLRVDELESRHATTRAGLPVGSVAPGFSLPSLSGQLVTFGRGAPDQRPSTLVFTDHRCGPCRQIVETLARQVPKVDPATRILVITDGDEPANRRLFEKYDADSVLLQRQDEVATVYEASMTPSLVQIDAHGRIATPLIAGRDEVLWSITRSVPTGQ